MPEKTCDRGDEIEKRQRIQEEDESEIFRLTEKVADLESLGNVQRVIEAYLEWFYASPYDRPIDAPLDEYLAYLAGSEIAE